MKKKRNRITGILALFAALAMILSLGVPAATGKGKPTKEKVAVEMSYEGAGIATACQEPVLMMNQDGKGMLRADWPANTDVEMSLPIAWARNHPEPAAGEALTGCHGDRVSEADGFSGYFILAPGPDGSVDLASRFDYYWEYECVTVKKGRHDREECTQTVLELFEIDGNLTMDGGHFDFSSTEPQTISGKAKLFRFEKLGDDGAWIEYGTTDITITITIGGS